MISPFLTLAASGSMDQIGAAGLLIVLALSVAWGWVEAYREGKKKERDQGW